MYIFSVLLPIFFIWLEYAKKIDFAEIFYLIIAKMTLTIGKDEIAKQYLLRLVEKYTDSYKGHKMLAELYEKNEKYELALEEYEKVYELNPKDENIYLRIGKL